jgi:hypothetical protein
MNRGKEDEELKESREHKESKECKEPKAEMEPVPATGRSGPVRYRSGFQTGRSAVRPVSYRSTGQLPFDRSITVRPVRPVDRPVRSGLTYSDWYRYRSSKIQTGSIYVYK